MKQMTKKWVKAGVTVALLAAAAGGFFYVVSRPEEYRTVRLSVENLEELVETDGEIKGGDYRFYFSEVTAPIAELKVKEGRAVTEGEKLVSYDVQDLETAARLAASEANQVYAEGNAVLENNERLNEYVDQAFTDYDMASFMVDYFQAYVDYTRDELAQYEQDGKEVTKAELELEDYQNKMNFMEKEKDRDKWRERAFDKSMDVIGKKEEYLEIDEITMKKNLEGYEEKLAEWKAKKEKYETHAENKLQLLTPSDATRISAAKQSASIQKEDAQRILTLAEEGIVAGESGVVSEVLVEEGSLVSKGTPLFVIQDTGTKKAEVYLSKYDISKVKAGQKARVEIGDMFCEGTVSEIYQIARKEDSDEAQVLAEITLQNAEKNICPGLEADVEIVVESREGVRTLPVEALYTDDEGDYCYCIEQGVLTKKYVVKGISDGSRTEITEGLVDTDEIVLDAVTDEKLGEKAKGTAYEK